MNSDRQSDISSFARNSPQFPVFLDEPTEVSDSDVELVVIFRLPRGLIVTKLSPFHQIPVKGEKRRVWLKCALFRVNNDTIQKWSQSKDGL